MISHIEELPIKKFIECITTLDKFIVSEKIDGTELVFGFDDRGKFYTTREHKSGKRYYSEAAWPKQFWTTGFRSAHLALENIQNVLKLTMNPGDSIEVEILFGPQPNTVPYNADGINRIIFLRPLSCEIDLKKLTDKINTCILRGIKVELDDIPTTTDGVNFILEKTQGYKWQFETVPIIKLEKAINKNISKTINELNLYLNQTSLLEKTNIETAGLRVTKTNKLIVEETRLKLQEFKSKIKKQLVESLLSNKSSVFGPTVKHGGWIEGYVFRHPETGFQFKLIDKEKFTRINKENHQIQDYIRETHWKILKDNLYKVCDITSEDKKLKRIYFEDYKDLANKNFEKPFASIKKEIQSKCWSTLKALHNEYSSVMMNHKNINETTKQKVMQEFSGLRKRISDINNKCFEATCTEHLIELIMTEDMKADHKKHFSNNTRRIYVEEIPKTLKYISKITNLPLQELQENTLGSVGISDSSGDIDIAVDIKKYNKDDLLQTIRQNFTDDEILVSAGLDIIHLILPICGNKSNGFVQVDLMMSESIEWTKFYSQHKASSKYKGLYRNALLSALVGATNMTSYDNEELIDREGYVLVPSKGIQWQHKKRFKGTNDNYLKTFKVVKRGGIETNPTNILNIMFENFPINLHHIETFENTIDAIKKSYVNKELVKEIAIKIITDKKRPIPRELLSL